MRTIITVIILLMANIPAYTQLHEMIYLWPEKVPGETKPKSLPIVETERNDKNLRYSEITDPSIEVFEPVKSKNNNAAVIVCPGGGYRILSYQLEGTEVAGWLNSLGYTVFILSYRIPDKKQGALQDLQRAVRLARSNSSKYNYDLNKIGVLGFSAGGSLCARLSTRTSINFYTPVDSADDLSCRPDFALLIYPAYLDLGPGNTLTPELVPDSNVPPVFIFQTADDSHGNSAIVMAEALRKAKLSIELHILPEGGHGYGLRKGNRAAETWTTLAETWLKTILKQ